MHITSYWEMESVISKLFSHFLRQEMESQFFSGFPLEKIGGILLPSHVSLKLNIYWENQHYNHAKLKKFPGAPEKNQQMQGLEDNLENRISNLLFFYLNDLMSDWSRQIFLTRFQLRVVTTVVIYSFWTEFEQN